jgi:hypothetical protein
LRFCLRTEAAHGVVVQKVGKQDQQVCPDGQSGQDALMGGRAPADVLPNLDAQPHQDVRNVPQAVCPYYDGVHFNSSVVQPYINDNESHLKVKGGKTA